MKPILSGLLGFILLYLISDVFVKNFTIGLLPIDVSQTLFGNEEEFLEPFTMGSFLELLHIEIFFMMMLLLTLSAVYIRLRRKQTRSSISLHLLMGGAILSIVSLFLSYFVSEIFIYVYVVSFFLWRICAAYMVLSSLWRLYRE